MKESYKELVNKSNQKKSKGDKWQKLPIVKQENSKV